MSDVIGYYILWNETLYYTSQKKRYILRQCNDVSLCLTLQWLAIHQLVTREWIAIRTLVTCEWLAIHSDWFLLFMTMSWAFQLVV